MGKKNLHMQKNYFSPTGLMVFVCPDLIGANEKKYISVFSVALWLCGEY